MYKKIRVYQNTLTVIKINFVTINEIIMLLDPKFYRHAHDDQREGPV